MTSISELALELKRSLTVRGRFLNMSVVQNGFSPLETVRDPIGILEVSTTSSLG
jgi:hypothetical protein